MHLMPVNIRGMREGSGTTMVTIPRLANWEVSQFHDGSKPAVLRLSRLSLKPLTPAPVTAAQSMRSKLCPSTGV